MSMIAFFLLAPWGIAIALCIIGEVIDRWNTKRERAHQEFVAQCAASAALHKAQRESRE